MTRAEAVEVIRAAARDEQGNPYPPSEATIKAILDQVIETAKKESLGDQSYAVRALDAAALWEPKSMLELATTLERHSAVCEGQYLRGIAYRLMNRQQQNGAGR